LIHQHDVLQRPPVGQPEGFSVWANRSAYINCNPSWLNFGGVVGTSVTAESTPLSGQALKIAAKDLVSRSSGEIARAR